jgi:protein-S-isoprenylcysteine O-methyltransferase Ste14
MKTQLRPARREQPHPLVTILGLLIVLALIVISLKTRLLPSPVVMIPFAICFLMAFHWASRWSARAMRERRERELERVRHTPVLGLND